MGSGRQLLQENVPGLWATEAVTASPPGRTVRLMGTEPQALSADSLPHAAAGLTGPPSAAETPQATEHAACPAQEGVCLQGPSAAPAVTASSSSQAPEAAQLGRSWGAWHRRWCRGCTRSAVPGLLGSVGGRACPLLAELCSLGASLRGCVLVLGSVRKDRRLRTEKLKKVLHESLIRESGSKPSELASRTAALVHGGQNLGVARLDAGPAAGGVAGQSHRPHAEGLPFGLLLCSH